MTDRYQDFVSSPLGKLLVKNLGLPNPVRLDRYVAGSPLVDGTVVVGGWGRLAESLPRTLQALDISTVAVTEADTRYRGLVFDATGLTDPTQLVALRDFFTPLMRSLETCSRLVVLGTPPEQVSAFAHSALVRWCRTRILRRSCSPRRRRRTCSRSMAARIPR